MKLIRHVPGFMLNTRLSHQVLKVSTLGFQSCLHTTFHIMTQYIIRHLNAFRANFLVQRIIFIFSASMIAEAGIP
jgi:hypothetical protein